MTTYKKLTWDSYKIQVESAVRDGNGATISTTYATKTELSTGLGNKLDTTVAASTYLTITNAASTYLAKTDAASTYATQTALSDGLATKADIATTLAGYGITDGVTTDTAQDIPGEKTFSANMFLGKTAGTVRDIRCIENSIRTGMIRFDSSAGENDVSIYTFAPGSDSLGSTVSAILHKTSTEGWLTTSYRAYNSANVNDVVTIGSLASNPSVIHATGNETKSGSLTFNNDIVMVGNIYKRSGIDYSVAPTAYQSFGDLIVWRDSESRVLSSMRRDRDTTYDRTFISLSKYVNSSRTDTVALDVKLDSNNAAQLVLRKTINGVSSNTTIANL